MAELKKCVHCGSDRVGYDRGDYADWWVECGKCGARGPVACNRMKAGHLWNTRADDWISVEDRLPTGSGMFIVHIDFEVENEYPDVQQGDFIDGAWRLGWGFDGKWEVTHWRPLPEPPKGAGE